MEIREKIEKLILSGGDDLLIANELILETGLEVIPEDFEELPPWNTRRGDKQYYSNGTKDIYVLKEDKTWVVVHTTTSTSTTTVIGNFTKRKGKKKI